MEGLAPIFDLLARSIGQVTRTTVEPADVRPAEGASAS